MATPVRPWDEPRIPPPTFLDGLKAQRDLTRKTLDRFERAIRTLEKHPELIAFMEDLRGF